MVAVIDLPAQDPPRLQVDPTWLIDAQQGALRPTTRWRRTWGPSLFVRWICQSLRECMVSDANHQPSCSFPRRRGSFQRLPRKNICLTNTHRGRLSQDRITKKPKLTCRNWECGVVMQVEQGHVKARLHPPSANDIKVTGCTENLVEVFQHSVPVPMQIPGVSFLPPSEEEGRGTRTPWFFQG